MITAAQCKAARALLGMGQNDLASTAGVGRSTVIDFEQGTRSPQRAKLDAIVAALEAAGVQFIAENGGGAGVRLRK